MENEDEVAKLGPILLSDTLDRSPLDAQLLLLLLMLLLLLLLLLMLLLLISAILRLLKSS